MPLHPPQTIAKSITSQSALFYAQHIFDSVICCGWFVKRHCHRHTRQHVQKLHFDVLQQHIVTSDCHRAVATCCPIAVRIIAYI